MDDLEQDPQQERRLLLALLLSMGVLFFFAPRGEAPAPEGEGGVVAAATPTPAALEPAPTPAPSEPTAAPGQAPVEPSSVDVSWPEVDAVWSSYGGGPSSLHINGWHEPYEQDWLPTWLLSGFTNGFRWEPFDIGCKDAEVVDIVKDDAAVTLPVGWDDRGIDADSGHYAVQRGAEGFAFTAQRGDLAITKRFATPGAGYVTGYTVEFRNTGSGPQRVMPTFGVADKMEVGENRYGPQPEAWADVGGAVHKGPGAMKKRPREWEGEVSWLGVGDRYFLTGIEPAEPIEGKLVLQEAPGEERFASVVHAPPFDLAPGEVKSFSFKLWTGPRELQTLRQADVRMESAVDFGWFGLIALPILWFLKTIQGLVGSWGLSIILLTVVIKGMLFPLTHRSFKSMRAMQALQPEIEKLKEKHGEDREALNTAMMGLWREHNVNPVGGCLPMLIQMPIWFALYRVLWNAVELYQTPFLYFCDLSLLDPIGIFPLVLGVTMWLQQQFTPTTSQDPAQQAVMKFMPLFFSIIMFTLPAGLVVYILVNNVLSIAQHWMIHRQHPTPQKS